MNETQPATSPPWSRNTKLVVALTFMAIIAGLLIRFHTIIVPLLMAFVLSYLFHPVAGFINRYLPISWRLAVSLLYLILIILLAGLLILGGLGLIQQIQSLIDLIQNSLAALPDLFEQITGQLIIFGPFRFDLSHLDLNAYSRQVLSIVQPLLGKTGDLVGTLAGGAIQIFGWTAFIFLVSYFVLIESGGLRGRILNIDIPGYKNDVYKLGLRLGLIWNAFLRGQIIIFVITVFVYTFLLNILGVRYAIGLALLAGLARFLPYIGPFITWMTLGLVAYFQTYKLFGLQPLTYTILVVGLALLIDQFFDNLVSPRIMANALKVHPAAVLVAAIIAANLLGLLGVMIAAPILATLKLVGQYTSRKMLGVDPWPEADEIPPPLKPKLWTQLRRRWRSLRKKRH
jgi:predicted PurR-regulated permease PerM